MEKDTKNSTSPPTTELLLADTVHTETESETYIWKFGPFRLVLPSHKFCPQQKPATFLKVCLFTRHGCWVRAVQGTWCCGDGLPASWPQGQVHPGNHTVVFKELGTVVMAYLQAGLKDKFTQVNIL